MQQVQESRSVDQGDLLVPRELVGAPAVVGRSHQDAPAGTLTLHGAVELPHGGRRDGLAIALGLHDRLPSLEGVGVYYHGVDALVAASARDVDLRALVGEDLLENVAHEHLEVLPVHGDQVVPRLELLKYLSGLDEPRILSLDPSYGRHRLERR